MRQNAVPEEICPASPYVSALSFCLNTEGRAVIFEMIQLFSPMQAAYAE